jgi:uncharacterized protein (UPF0332 family)
MSIHIDLLLQARRLARLDPMRPRQANLRRAISSAYYALFHYLIDQACRSVLGTHQAQLPYRQVIGRGFDHGSMKRACRSFAGGNLPQGVARGLPAGFAIPNDLQNVAQTFVELQEQRHLADYDLSQRFARAEVLALVAQADQARLQFHHMNDRTMQRFFLACLMTWKTLVNRD